MKYVMLLAKFFCTGLLLYFVFRGIDFTQTKSMLYSSKGLMIISLGAVIFITQTMIAGLRQKYVLDVFNFKITTFYGIKLWFIANFFSQIFISFIGGDAMRIVSLVRSGMPYGQSARAIFMDRVLSFISLQFLYFISLFFLLNMLSNGALRWGILGLGVLSLGAIVMFFVLGCMPNRFHNIKYIGKILDLAAISRYLYNTKLKTMYILLLNCLVHLCNVYAIYAIACVLGANISFLNAFMIGIPVMYISMLPFSVGGWGLRENSMIIGFAIIGLSSEIALTASIALGIGFMIASLPGGLIFWHRSPSAIEAGISNKNGILTNV